MNTITIMHKLQRALKQKGIIICISTIQFYSKEQNRYIKVYHVRNGKEELLKTASQIQVITLLNQYWQEVKDDKGNR